MIFGLIDSQTLTVICTGLGAGLASWFAKGMNDRRKANGHAAEHERIRKRFSGQALMITEQEKAINAEKTKTAVLDTRLGGIEEHVKTGFNDMREFNGAVGERFEALNKELVEIRERLPRKTGT